MSFKRRIRRAIKENRPPKINDKVKSKVDKLLAKRQKATSGERDGDE